VVFISKSKALTDIILKKSSHLTDSETERDCSDLLSGLLVQLATVQAGHPLRSFRSVLPRVEGEVAQVQPEALLLYRAIQSLLDQY
jgi:hypothetical protein